MLAQFTLLVFGIFAVLTLVIDMGLVTLTRVQMQNAADSAALEGVRQRDGVPDDGYASDCVRRINARDLVRWTFDDDFGLTGDARQFGAGPIIDFTPGVGDLDALRTMSLPDVHVYKPDLQYNQASNAPEGDLVSGNFNPASPLGDEASDYSRADFAPTAAPPPGASALPECPDEVPDPWPAPASGAPAVGDDAFLVRLRRTNDVDGLDEIPNVSSRGPTLPLLFGRGALLGAELGGTYSVRRDGLTVRAAAVAWARPALRVGLPGVGPAGVTPFAITSEFAAVLSTGPTAVTVEPTGFLMQSGDVVGQFVVDAALIATVSWPVPPAATASCPAGNAIAGYTPIFDAIGATLADRVVGFAPITIAWVDCASDPTSATLTLGPQIVAPANATVFLPDGLSTDLPAGDEVALFDKTTALNTAGIALLAPVVAR